MAETNPRRQIEGKLAASPSFRVERTIEGASVTESFHGPFKECLELVKSIELGYLYNSEVFDGYSERFSSISVSRQNAGRAQLDFTTKEIPRLSWWSLSFSEISKPISSWFAEKMRKDNPTDDTIEDRIATELGKIRLWQSLESSNPTAYMAYQYDGTTALTSTTLDLAKKIRKGEESYSIYAPVVTVTRTAVDGFSDRLNEIGGYYKGPLNKIFNLSSWPPANEAQFDSFRALKPIWFKQSDAIQQNTDQTVTRTEQFQGLDWIDPDLYPEMEEQEQSTTGE